MKTVKLQTPVETSPAPFEVTHEGPLLFMGSCFAERIGQRLQQLHFPVLLNPFGILYNPLSMADALRRCLDDSPITGRELVLHEGLWHSWLHHGSFSQPDKEACLAACNEAIHEAHRFLSQCRTVVLTFGSAWCYSVAEGDYNGIVANCHKVPATRFSRRLASVEEVTAAWQPLLQRLLAAGMQVLLTVSPVRHSAYGAHGNQLGKAVLLLAIERLIAQLPAEQQRAVAYFPAYEIMMDELRDYRFYADDLLHPSTMAEEIVWQRFAAFCMSETTRTLCDTLDKEYRRAAHRTLHPDRKPAPPSDTTE